MFDGVDEVFREGVEVGQESFHVRSIMEVSNAVVYKVSVGAGRIRVGIRGSFVYLCYPDIRQQFNLSYFLRFFIV